MPSVSLLPPQRPSRPPFKSAARGFTLVEMVITALIVAILAAIALPSYQSHVRSTRRGDGQSALQRIQLEQEKWRSNSTSYTETLSDLGMSGTSNDGHYTLSLSGGSGSGYTATATATGSQAGDTACATLQLAVTNGVNVSTTPTECWKK